MPIAAQQYFDPHCYDIDVPANASAAVTLRAAILAISGGTLPPSPAGIVAFEFIPVAASLVIGGYDRPTKTFKTAAAGGADIPVGTDGKAFDVSDPLDSVQVKSAAAATTAKLILYLGASAS